jgi:filamentous hemagglutinin
LLNDFLYDTLRDLGASQKDAANLGDILEAVLHVGASFGLGRFGNAQLNLGRGVRDLDPWERGVVIEKQLGQNLPSNFPVIDRFDNGLVTSIKSMDLAAQSYQDASGILRVGEEYVDAVARFQGRNWAGVNIRQIDITARGLDLAIPAGATPTQQQALQNLITYGRIKGVTVRLVVVE